MPTEYDGNPTAAHSPALAPGNAVDVTFNLPVDGDLRNVSSVYQPFQTAADWIAWLRDNRARTTLSFATSDAVMTGAPGEGHVLTASAITYTQGAAVMKQVAVAVSIELTAGSNDVVVTLTNSLAFATAIDVVVGSLTSWAGGTPAAPLVRCVRTVPNTVTIYVQGMGDAVTCQVSFIAQGY